MADKSPQPDRIPLTIEVTPAQKRRIERLAEREGRSPEAVVRTAIDRELDAASSNGDGATGGPRPESLLAATQDLAGSVDDEDAPSDLSSNPKHMEGYGQ